MVKKMKSGPKFVLIGIALIVLIYTSYKIGYTVGFYDGYSIVQENKK